MRKITRSAKDSIELSDRFTTALVLLVLVFAGPAAISPSSAASFQGLGFLPGGACSEAAAVSADGSTVVGASCTPSGVQAFRWTAAERMVAVSVPDGLIKSWATDVSADGAFVVGYGRKSDSPPYGYEGFRWHISGHIDRIAVPGFNVTATSISGDGSVVVGTAWATGSDEYAFRWTAADGLVPLEGIYGEHIRSSAEAISANGSVVVGHRIYDGYPYRDCFWWSNGYVTGFNAHTANATSSDGSIVAGGADNLQTQLFEAYRWTRQSGLRFLGTCLPNHHSRALGVSPEDPVIVGYVQNNSGFDEQKAFIWDDARGMRLLQDVLENDFGLDLSGWHLAEPWASWRATDISDNALTIVGVAEHSQTQREAFRAVLCETGDFEPDGDVDLYDLAILAAAWQSNRGDAHWNRDCDISQPNDEAVNALDLSVFAEHWLKDTTAQATKF